MNSEEAVKLIRECKTKEELLALMDRVIREGLESPVASYLAVDVILYAVIGMEIEDIKKRLTALEIEDIKKRLTEPG